MGNKPHSFLPGCAALSYWAAQNAAKQKCMLNNACTQTTEPQSPDSQSFAHLGQAIESLTSPDYAWLRRVAARRLCKLRTHPGLARYLAGMEPDDLVNEAIKRLQAGSRRTKPRHLASPQTFRNHLQGVMNSLAANFTRHAEPHVAHLNLQADAAEEPVMELAATDDVAREVEERDWLRSVLAALELTASTEQLEELAKVREAQAQGLPADQVVHQLSEGLRSQLAVQIAPELNPSLAQ